MVKLKFILESRLAGLENISSQGLIPGELDSIELHQLLGRIEEVKFLLSALEVIEEGIIQE